MAFYSFSKLGTYNKCSHYFYLYYLDKSVPKPDTDNKNTVLGNACHDVLEEYYLQFMVPPVGDGVPVIKPVETLLEEWWVKRLTDDGLSAILPSLVGYEQHLAWLYHKATEAYTGPDAIRSGKGNFRKVPTKPEMTSDWKVQFVTAGLDQLSAQIEAYTRAVASEREVARDAKQAAEPDVKLPRLKSRHWLKMQIQDIYTQTWAILRGYVDPVAGTTIHGVEYKLTDYDRDFKHMVNPVELIAAHQKPLYPGLADSPMLDVAATFLTGFIDLVVIDGQGRVYIIDHKTSKGGPPALYKVILWEQLLIYGWAWHKLTGRYPDFIGINQLRDKTLVCAPFDPVLAEQAIRRKLGAIKGIDAEVFIMQNPSDFGASCIGFGGEACGYLAHCHPAYAAGHEADKANKAADAWND